MEAPASSPSPRSAHVRLAPFLWLAVTLLAASVFAMALQGLFSVGPDAGTWNPTWSLAEIELAGVESDDAQTLVREWRSERPGHHFELREGASAPWVVLVGTEPHTELLATLHELAQDRGLTVERIGFGSNLARITGRLLQDPGGLVAAARALLPLTLFGGSLILLGFGTVLRRRSSFPGEALDGPSASGRGWSVRCGQGVALGVALSLVVEVTSWGLARLGAPVVEQSWVLEVVEEGGSQLFLVALMVVLVVPLAEEVFFRGYLLPALRIGWGPRGALVLSSAAFAGVHGHLPGLPVYFLLGLGLGLAARRSGTLLVPVVAHVTINGLALGRMVV